MALTPVGLGFIKSWEGYRATIYICAAGIPTIGYGHALMTKAERKLYEGVSISKEQALQLLLKDLAKFEASVDKLVKVKLEAHQRDALVSLCYNIGIGAFAASTLLKLLNQGHYNLAAEQFNRWINGGKPPKAIQGLVNRRRKEYKMFKGETIKLSLVHNALTPEYCRIARCA